MFPLGAADPALCTFLHDAFSLYFAAIPNYMNISGAGYGAGTIIPSELEGEGEPGGGRRGRHHSESAAGLSRVLTICGLSLCTAQCSAHAPWLSLYCSPNRPRAAPTGAGPLAAVVTPQAKAKQAAAVSQFFKGKGTMARLAKTKHPLMWMG